MVTSRATDDNLTGDQEPRTSDIMASPRQPLGQSLGKPTPAKSDTDNSAPAKTASPDDTVSDGMAGGGVSPNGASAGGKEDALANGGLAAGGATVVDGIPALPADTIGSSRSSQPKQPDADQGAGSTAANQSPAGDSPVLSFARPPAAPGVEDQIIAYPAESSVKPAGENPAGPVSAGPGPAGSGPSGPAPAASRSAPAEPPSVSPAAFAWEMPDPPPDSRSSPARTFLRSGTTGKNPPVPQTGSPGRPGQACGG